jgi:hypothetical protein
MAGVFTPELLVWLLVAFLGGILAGLVKLRRDRAAARAKADAEGYPQGSQ